MFGLDIFIVIVLVVVEVNRVGKTDDTVLLTLIVYAPDAVLEVPLTIILLLCGKLIFHVILAGGITL